MTVYFIGAGPGAADLITVRGLRLIERCPVCLYAGSLVPADVVAAAPAGALVKDTAPLHLDEIIADLTKDATAEELLSDSGVLKELKKRLVETALEAEMTEHLGYEKHAPRGEGTTNARNGSRSKTLKTDDGELEIDVPEGDLDIRPQCRAQQVPTGQAPAGRLGEGLADALERPTPAGLRAVHDAGEHDAAQEAAQDRIGRDRDVPAAGRVQGGVDPRDPHPFALREGGDGGLTGHDPGRRRLPAQGRGGRLR